MKMKCKMSLLLLVLLSTICTVSALPAPPPLPGMDDDTLPDPPPFPDPDSIPEVASVFLIVDEMVSPSFAVDVYHTANVQYYCELSMNGEPLSDIFVLRKDEIESIELSDFDEGVYTVDVLCSIDDIGSSVMENSATFTVMDYKHDLLVLLVPSDVENTFTVTIGHTGSNTYRCAASIDEGEPHGYTLAPFSLNKNSFREVTFSDVSVGQHAISASCTGVDGTIDAEKLVQVTDTAQCTSTLDCSIGKVCVTGVCVSTICVDDTDCAAGEVCIEWECTSNVSCFDDTDCGPEGMCLANGTCAIDPSEFSVVLTAPSSQVNGTSVNITYHHTANTKLYCILTTDEVSWEDNRALQADAKITEVAPSEQITETIDGLQEGLHVAHVVCSELGGAAGEDFKIFTVENVLLPQTTEYVEINLSYPETKAEIELNVTFRHNATTKGVCNVTIDGALTEENEIPPNTAVTYMYNLSSGHYTFAVDCLGVNWHARETREVAVNNFADDLETNVTILEGNLLIENESFTVSGTEFLENSEVNLYLTGLGSSRLNHTTVDNGRFSFVYPGLQAGTYVITAKSINDQTVQASFDFVVVRDTDPPEIENPDPQPDTEQTIGQNPPPDTQQQEAVETQVEQTPRQADVPEPLSAVRTPIEERPEPLEKSSTWGWMIPLLLVLIVGGLLGWFVYNGSVDVHSWGAFVASLRSFKNGTVHGQMGATKGTTKNSTGNSTLASFIQNERKKGFDDLTIRGALLKKGWAKEDVDGEFDSIYKTP